MQSNNSSLNEFNQKKCIQNKHGQSKLDQSKHGQSKHGDQINNQPLFSELRNHIIDNFDLSKELSDEEIEEIIEEEIFKYGQHQHLSIQEKLLYKNALFNSIRGLDILQDLVDDDTISEIMVNGNNGIFIEQDGSIYELDLKFSSIEKMNDVIQQIASISNRRVNESSPILDCRLRDGSRVNIVLPPVALDGPSITIRKFKKNHFTMNQLIEMKSIDSFAADYLKVLVAAGYNIFVSGGTGSGKTTFLNILSDFIPSDERVITIEDSAELQLTSISNLIRLESRQANTEGALEITIRDLIKSSLRMRPDRIVVGEVRGGEALDMITAMNTGHSSMSTGHANSATDMLSRLETMILMGAEIPISAIRGQIAAGLDIIVHLGRLRDKSRRVLEILEVCDYNGQEIVLNPLFMFEETGFENNKVIGHLVRTKNSLKNTVKLNLSGLSLPTNI